VARYTETEHQLALLQHDLAWSERIAHLPHADGVARETLCAWIDRLALLHDHCGDRRMRQQIMAAQRELQQALWTIGS
jgi:hypothetical protein